MKSYRNKRPVIVVSLDDYERMADTTEHMFTTKLEKKYLKFLPGAYESSTGTQLVFPHQLCPKAIRFRPKWRLFAKRITRQVVNITAIKNEDMSESLIFRLK